MDWVDWIKVSISIDTSSPFSFYVVKSWFLAIHGWLTGARVEVPAAILGGFFLLH
jgi:hypothetical protein